MKTKTTKIINIIGNTSLLAGLVLLAVESEDIVAFAIIKSIALILLFAGVMNVRRQYPEE